MCLAAPLAAPSPAAHSAAPPPSQPDGLHASSRGWLCTPGKQAPKRTRPPGGGNESHRPVKTSSNEICSRMAFACALVALTTLKCTQPHTEAQPQQINAHPPQQSGNPRFTPSSLHSKNLADTVRAGYITSRPTHRGPRRAAQRTGGGCATAPQQPEERERPTPPQTERHRGARPAVPRSSVGETPSPENKGGPDTPMSSPHTRR